MLSSFPSEISPRFTLIGAGPGDPELLTLKAVKALQKAKVILYDALVQPETLDFASADAIMHFVGKRSGNHAYKQEEINELIVQYALSHGDVVRLKGGDPFVFGRGYEELAYAEKFNIETLVIPGLTSATALPALHKIPLTTRGENESFWVLTGTTSDRKVSADVYKAAQTKATAVILMGMRKLTKITEIYKAAGKAQLPIAVIINGSKLDEEIIIGRVNTIEEQLNQKTTTGPGLLIIGEAVKHYATVHQHTDYSQQLLSLSI